MNKQITIEASANAADPCSYTVELPESSIPKRARSPKKPFMFVFALILIVSLTNSHKRYTHAMDIWQQEEAAELEKAAQAVKLAKREDQSEMSKNTRAIQSQIAQMKNLMEKRRKVQEMEMEVFRYEMGLHKPKLEPEAVSADQESQQLAGGGVSGQDVDFARDVAKQAVKQEVEDFLQKVDLISKVGGYVAKRISD